MSTASTNPKPDDVHLVRDFWDEPLSGIATLDGAFHAFQRIYDEGAQAWSQEFLLRPLTGVELAQFNEMDGIFKGWREAYDRGDLKPHPLMPEAAGPAADRYKVLHQITDAILHEETARTFRCTGTMVAVPGPQKRYVVHWRRA